MIFSFFKTKYLKFLFTENGEQYIGITQPFQK